MQITFKILDKSNNKREQNEANVELLEMFSITLEWFPFLKKYYLYLQPQGSTFIKTRRESKLQNEQKNPTISSIISGN